MRMLLNRLLKKLLAPVIREVIKEIIRERKESANPLSLEDWGKSAKGTIPLPQKD